MFDLKPTELLLLLFILAVIVAVVTLVASLTWRLVVAFREGRRERLHSNSDDRAGRD